MGEAARAHRLATTRARLFDYVAGVVGGPQSANPKTGQVPVVPPGASVTRTVALVSGASTLILSMRRLAVVT